MPAPPAKFDLVWIVVHGSYGPGGAHHDRLSELGGDWHPGSFSAVAGEHFDDLVVQRFGGEPVRGWALQLAPKPDKAEPATDEQGNTPHQLFERWAGIDALFDDDVVRMDTTFQFDERQPQEGDICRANTYGSTQMIPDGRYDAVHPGLDGVALWRNVVDGTKHYDPSTFARLILDLQPAEYDETFATLDNHAGFVQRLQRLAQDQIPPSGSGGAEVDFAPQPHNAVEDNKLIALARQAIQTKSEVIGDFAGKSWVANATMVDALKYQMAEAGAPPELGDLHYEVAEQFADACAGADIASWSSSLGLACYSLAQSYDLLYWLTQDWSVAKGDLEPLYHFWRAGGSVAIDIAGVAHVSTSHTR